MLRRKSDMMEFSTADLLARRRGLVDRLGDVEQVLLGSVVEQTRRCGKVACRCAAAQPHGPYTYLTTRRGRRGMRYVPAALIPVVAAYVRHGEHVESVLAEISAINVELLARRELGQEYAGLVIRFAGRSNRRGPNGRTRTNAGHLECLRGHPAGQARGD